MQSLKSALNTALKQGGIDKAVRQNESLFIWEEVVGKAVAKNSTPEEVKHGVLIVRGATPVWRNELVLKKTEIVNKLNERLGGRIIKDLRVI